MILTKDQIYRYMRHILMPEISGHGQKKILGSSVILYSENLDTASLALYYLAASGVGEVFCTAANVSSSGDLSGKLSDLNSDSKFHLLGEDTIENSNVQATTRIVAGSPIFVFKTLKDILTSDSDEKYLPTIVSINNGWRGSVQTFIEKAGLKEFLLETERSADCSSFNTNGCDHRLSGYFSSIMAVIEHLKVTLSLGKPLSSPLFYDLSIMEFDFHDSPSDLLCKLQSHYKPENILKPLADSKVLIVGCGGLGSPAAYALAAAGIGRLGLVDFDAVELSNLNRQIMHSSSRIGMPKVQSSEIFLKQINPNIILELYNSKIGKENVHDIISSYDIIIGGLDNLSTRYILNDACLSAGKPLMEAGALDISGLATSIIPGEGHCYRCIFPESNDNNPLPSCSETGVLGPLPGLLGIIQAAEAIKLLTGIGRSLKNRILLVDVFDTDIFVANHGRNQYCELCSGK